MTFECPFTRARWAWDDQEHEEALRRYKRLVLLGAKDVLDEDPESLKHEGREVLHRPAGLREHLVAAHKVIRGYWARDVMKLVINGGSEFEQLCRDIEEGTAYGRYVAAFDLESQWGDSHPKVVCGIRIDFPGG